MLQPDWRRIGKDIQTPGVGSLRNFTENVKLDGFVKSRKSPNDRHSGLSGILLFQVVWQNDSRQAGMTTSYDFIKLEEATAIARLLKQADEHQ